MAENDLLRHNSNTPSDDSDHDTNSNNSVPELKGYLSKWTNYIHGWQPRFIVLKDGTLSYYKSEFESDYGCRGVISLDKATIKSHEFDECRFDVSVNNCVWYLRAETLEDKTHWVDVLQSYKVPVGIDMTALMRHGSTISLQSNSIIFNQNSGNSGLKEKINEIETFRDILSGQINTLQRYYDVCASKRKPNSSDLPSDLNSIDLKGESLTFRATSQTILATLNQCLDIINQREEYLKKKMETEIERRRQSEELCKKLKDELSKTKSPAFFGPDSEEGPHSTLPEDEFFDAVETGLDKIEEDRQLRVRLKLQSQQSQSSTTSSILIPDQNDDQATEKEDDEFGTGNAAKVHRLWPQIDDICKEQLRYARQGVGEGGNGWQLFADEGEMKMYRREQEIDGMVVDPLKACHIVKGVSAREMCHYFFMPEYRNDWETTLDDMAILEKISPDTIVFLQTHKRIWPASQRDALFWSHMRKVTDHEDKTAHDEWLVCNHSIDLDSYPANTGKCVRIFLTVIMYCQTYIDPAVIAKGVKPTRNDLTCKITYCSEVNPGGWAPASVLRAVYKREYPKFLKRFTDYVVEQCKNKPILH
ncbi:ceramide transfer protein isoform X1 [Sitodiplosis mosellana]|uniref:ceramide transfer protein isoform X1 n=1 Tax=Sitodiplosis mosellana TaxID=263140 RepID=UPI00244483EE|nr:ceramide transfer protein isoform X1 [Sitodiplosis mosellana]